MNIKSPFTIIVRVWRHDACIGTRRWRRWRRHNRCYHRIYVTPFANAVFAWTARTFGPWYTWLLINTACYLYNTCDVNYVLNKYICSFHCLTDVIHNIIITLTGLKLYLPWLMSVIMIIFCCKDTNKQICMLYKVDSRLSRF